MLDNCELVKALRLGVQVDWTFKIRTAIPRYAKVIRSIYLRRCGQSVRTTITPCHIHGAPEKQSSSSIVKLVLNMLFSNKTVTHLLKCISVYTLESFSVGWKLSFYHLNGRRHLQEGQARMTCKRCRPRDRNTRQFFSENSSCRERKGNNNCTNKKLKREISMRNSVEGWTTMRWQVCQTFWNDKMLEKKKLESFQETLKWAAEQIFMVV